MKKQTTVIYPGTFDPLTNGHYDLVERAVALFDKVIIAIASQSNKTTLFNLKERVQLAKQATKHLDTVSVLSFSCLLVDLVKKEQAHAVIRGLRAVSDFDYEFQLALMNRRLNNKVETIFLTPAEENTFISSTLVREVASLNGDVSQFTPDIVAQHVKRKFNS